MSCRPELGLGMEITWQRVEDEGPRRGTGLLCFWSFRESSGAGSASLTHIDIVPEDRSLGR